MKIRTIYPVVLVPLLCGILAGAMLLLILSPFTHATSSVPRITLATAASANSICKDTMHCKLVSSTPANQPITLAFGLNLRNTDNLTAYLAEITNPHSLFYHHYLNAASFAAQYGPFPQSEASIASFLPCPASAAARLLFRSFDDNACIGRAERSGSCRKAAMRAGPP